MIRIINDFFNEDELRSIQDFALTKATYTPCFFNEATEKNKKTIAKKQKNTPKSNTLGTKPYMPNLAYLKKGQKKEV